MRTMLTRKSGLDPGEGRSLSLFGGGSPFWLAHASGAVHELDEEAVVVPHLEPVD